MSDVADRLTEYLLHGGLYNPELMQHEKVRDLLIDCRDEIHRLREAIRRLAEQDATLSAVGGNVIVEMDATPNDAVPAADGEGIRRPEGSRVRASATPTGNTQGVLIGGWRTGKPTPQPTLTDEEREAVEAAIAALYDEEMGDFAATATATLRGLLERTK